MEPLKKAALDIVNMALNSPANDMERWVVALVAVSLFVWLFSRLCDRLELPNLSGMQGMIVPVLGLAVLIAATAAAKVYLYAEFKSLGPMLFVVATAAVASAVLIVPLINLYTGGNYMGTLTSWIVSLAAAVGLVLLVSAGFDAVRSGKTSFDRGEARNFETMQFMK
jgi:hypothetical protein